MDCLRGNAYIVFLLVITLFSEAWWVGRIPFSWLYHGGGLVLTIGFCTGLLLLRSAFEQYPHSIKLNLNEANKAIDICKQKRIAHRVKDEPQQFGYVVSKTIGFVYLEELMEIKLSC